MVNADGGKFAAFRAIRNGRQTVLAMGAAADDAHDGRVATAVR